MDMQFGGSQTLLWLSLAFSLAAPGAFGADQDPGPSGGGDPASSRIVSVPLIVDHGRLLVDGEIRLPDGSWRSLRLWIDSGTGDFIVSDDLASALGSSLSRRGGGPFLALRVGGVDLDLSGVRSASANSPSWLFRATGADANLPATILMKYRATFDFPDRTLSLEPGGNPVPQHAPLPFRVNPHSGIGAVGVRLGGTDLELAIDLGASYSFIDADAVRVVMEGHPEWPRMTGSAGDANMWGWFFPREEAWCVVRPDEFQIEDGGSGGTIVEGAAFVALPRESMGGLGSWYSQKTALPVAGFLGPNAFSAFRLVIDWPEERIFLERTGEFAKHDLDTVGIALRPELDGGYSVVAVARRGGQPLVEGLVAGDRLVAVDGSPLAGLTMGGAAALFAGKPGTRHSILAERGGERFVVIAEARRLP
jgi:hypothetical protein